jgi:hypothetical protein
MDSFNDQDIAALCDCFYDEFDSAFQRHKNDSQQCDRVEYLEWLGLAVITEFLFSAFLVCRVEQFVDSGACFPNYFACICTQIASG